MDPRIALAWLLACLALIVAATGPAWLGRGVYRGRDARGLELLKDWLSPEQLTCYDQYKYFEVIGSDSARVYRIHHGTQTNVEQLDSIGKPVCRWCFVPEGNLAAGDVMLAQKIALETNERSALAVANRL